MMRNEAGSSSGGESVVMDVGRRRSPCGYCKSGRRSSISHGLWAESLTIADYQDLLDRGWRRSGCFLYKPEMESTCCPAYTIRLRADDFDPSKEQLRVSRRMQRYLDGIWEGKKQDPGEKSIDLQGCASSNDLSSSSQMRFSGIDEHKSKEEELLNYISGQIDSATRSFVRSRDLPCATQYPKGLVKKVSQSKKRRLVQGSEDLLYTSNVSFQIAAILRRAKSDGDDVRLPGSTSNGSVTNGSSSDLSPDSVAEELVIALQHLVKTHDLSIKACKGHINFYSIVKQAPSDTENQLVSLSSESSTQHHSKEDDVLSKKSHRKQRKLEIFLNRSSFDPEEFALYKTYQTKVHNDEPDQVTESSYRRFLVDTPLIYVPPTGDDTVPPCGFGSFHQQYRIDGRLIAVGVIDILPKCLSSKYLFWDPDLAFLSLGKYSALQEISWVKENQRHCPSLQFYYLGYYIHSCPKMRYKAAYRPSELLCPLRYEWVPYDVARPLLDRTKFAVLSDYGSTQNEASTLTHEPESLMEQEQNDFGSGDSNDTYVGENEDMHNSDSGSSDDELFPDSNAQAAVPPENGSIGDLLLALRGTQVRYKDLQRALGVVDRAQLEDQLLRYMKVVGPQLSDRMVYSLG